MAEIVLATLNAKWIHSSFGLRYLHANLGALAPRAVIVEATIADRATDVAERILAEAPRIVGLGVYVWNAAESLALARVLKRVAPEVVLVLGGPEVSHETEQQEITRVADHVIQGEADLAFAELCAALLAGARPPARVIAAEVPDLAALALPYELYDDTDVSHRIVYVEASRGCPFTCEFCLSSLDVPVRQFPLPAFLAAMQGLLDRGVAHFKFVDRTFNLRIDTSRAILEFFLARLRPGLLLHFEMIPDRLPDALRELIARFPPGTLQLEVGVQTLDDAVAARISRRQDQEKLAANLRWLHAETSVHVHADLIAGLPGEDVATFARGFDRLLALRPHEIQVGILKRLRGTKVARHDAEQGMVYAAEPPYDVLQTSAMTFAELQAMRRFARVFDLVHNSGNFVLTAPLLWRTGSPFAAFTRFVTWLWPRTRAVHGIALHRLSELLFEYLVTDGCPRAEAGAALWRDYQRTRPHDWPRFLAEFAEFAEAAPLPRARERTSKASARQARHASG